MLMTLLVAAAIATPKQIDQAGRACFAALRDYEVIEVAHVRAHDVWPTPDRQQDIAAKLSVAHETVRDSFQLGIDLVPGQDISAPALSLLRAEQGAIAALVGLTADGPPDAQKAVQKVVRVFAGLFHLFPANGGEWDAHPPPRPVRGLAAVVPAAQRTRMSIWCECKDPQPVWNEVRQFRILVCATCRYPTRDASSD